MEGARDGKRRFKELKESLAAAKSAKKLLKQAGAAEAAAAENTGPSLEAHDME